MYHYSIPDPCFFPIQVTITKTQFSFPLFIQLAHFHCTATAVAVIVMLPCLEILISPAILFPSQVLQKKMQKMLLIVIKIKCRFIIEMEIRNQTRSLCIIFFKEQQHCQQFFATLYFFIIIIMTPGKTYMYGHFKDMLILLEVLEKYNYFEM